MIRKLDISDVQSYLQHLVRVFETKGLMSIHDATWVEDRRNASLSEENIHALFADPQVSIWGEIDNGNIVKSIRSELGTHQPIARLINFKSESQTPFNPVKSLLPMLDVVLSYYESIEVYTFFLLRRLDFFMSRRNVFWEDNPPLQRYNSYYDEIIEPGQESKHAMYRTLAGKITYPVKTAVVQMCLKQEYRTFGPMAEMYPPETKEMAKIASDKSRLACIIGVTTGKVGEALCNTFADTGSSVLPISRKDVDFYKDDWKETLLAKIPDVTTPLVIVINLYDHSPGKGYIQEQIFDLLWAKYKANENIQIVAIGSMAHYHELEGIPVEYTNSKRNLRNKVVGTGRLGSYLCKLLFIEPGVIEAYLETKPKWIAPYLTNKEMAEKVLALVESNSRFTFAMANGNHIYVPVP